MFDRTHPRTLAVALTVAAAALFGFTFPAQAAVMLTASSTSANQGDISGGDTISGFGLAGGNTIVALVSFEVGDESATLSATYNGLAMTQVAAAETDGGFGQYASVFYLINPGAGDASMDLVVTPSSTSFSTTDTLAVTAVSLSNVQGVSDTDTGTEGNLGSGVEVFTDVVADGLSVAAYADNTFGASSAPTISGAGSAVLDTVLSAQGGEFVASSGASAGYLHGWGSVDTTATNVQDQVIQGGSGSSREAMAIVSFTAIPTPAALPAGLGLLSLLILRRRNR